MIPQNLQEAIEELDRKLNKEDKEYIVENGSLAVHHSLGRWIRNNWGLWNEEDNELKISLKKLGYRNPDDMSNYIIKQYIRYLSNM